MATRAVSNDSLVGPVVARLDGWRGIIGDGFIALWDDLATDASEANAFNESWFLRVALEQFDAEDNVQLFTLWNGNQLIGLMPLSVQTRYGRWPMRHLQNWLHHNAFLGTPLVRRGYETDFWNSLLPILDCESGKALFAHFNGLATDGPLALALKKVCRNQHRRYALVHREERALLEGGMSADVYFESSVRSKKRKELRRQRNRLADEGTLTFSYRGDTANLDEWSAEFLRLERSGWKGGNGSALDCSAQTRALFVDALKGAAERGKLERLDVRLDGKPLAMLVNFVCAPGSFSFKTAFDEDYARFSPGVLLQIENLALLERSDIAWCDSCAAEGHPMIDSLWTGRRAIGRYSVAIGGAGRRAIFGALLEAELARSTSRKSAKPESQG